MNESLLESILEDADDADRETLREAWQRLEALQRAEPSPELARRFARTIELGRVAAPPSPFRGRRLLRLAAILVLGIAIGGLAVWLPGFRGDRAGHSKPGVDLPRLGRAATLAFEPRALAPRRLDAVESLADLATDAEAGRLLADIVIHDPSIGVRLAALEALEPYLADEAILRRLIQAVRDTESTHVRIRLIELFIDHRVEAAISEIESLRHDPHADDLVRETAQWASSRL